MTPEAEPAVRAAVEAVLVRYCTLLDTRRFAPLHGDVFTDDALFANEAGGWRGGPEIARRIEAVMQPFEGTAHVLSNLSVEVEGESARSLAYVTAWHWFRETADRGPGRPADWVMLGAYRDALVREPRGWRIRERRFERVGPGLVGVGRQPKLDL